MTEFQILDTLYALLGVFLFRFRNPNKYLIDVISILMFSVFMTGFLFFYFGELVGSIGWGISGGGLLVTYFIRKHRDGFRAGIDYVKCIAILAIATYPINFYEYDLFIQGKFIFISIAYILLPTSVVIYFYDRYLLKPVKNMKRKFIVILVVQSILIGITFVYAFIQQTKAVAAQKEAERNLVIAIENEKMKMHAVNEQIKLEFKLDSIQKTISK